MDRKTIDIEATPLSNNLTLHGDAQGGSGANKVYAKNPRKSESERVI